MNWKTGVLTSILAVTICLFTSLPVGAATPEQIVAAIDGGVGWLVDNQNADGSWGDWDQVAKTAFAVVKLQDRARELGTDEFDAAIQDGLDYVFANAVIEPYGAGSGICFRPGIDQWHETYTTGISMMAIANDGDLSQVVAAGPATGQTHGQVLQANVDFFVFTQNPVDGGWRYYGEYEWDSDQSNTGYAVLGLGYAEDAGIDTTAINAGLTNWVDVIQSPTNGGSCYTPNGGWENVLKTGNLIFQFTMLGIGPGDARFDAAIDFIEAHWRDTNLDPGWGYNVDGAKDIQAMYCLMKGLQFSGVDLIDTDGDGVSDNDWFNQDPPAAPAEDFASVLVAIQEADGSWMDNNWGWGDPLLGTVWALLTLEKVTVVLNEPPDCSEAYADPGCLWPPNHKMVPISIMGVTDPDGDPIIIEITGITSDEPTASDKGSGGPTHAPDAEGVGTDTALVRAERSGNGNGETKGKGKGHGNDDGNGRVYVISFIASDGQGGECECTVTVCVPHDQSGSVAIDDGQMYDATGIN